MISRRAETNFNSNQPVRFYKIVAIAFLAITVILFGIIVFMSSKKAIITIITKPSPVEASIIVGNSDEGQELGIVFATTTVSLKETFKPTGTRQEPSQATGKVTLYNEAEYSQPLVATTRLLNPEGVLFRLKNRVVVPAKGEVEAEVYADQPGEGGNIGPSKFTIPGLSEPKQKVIYATSKESMNGGVRTIGIVKAEDLKNAEDKFLEELKQKGESVLAPLHPDKKAVFLAIQPNIKNNVEVGKEISEFTLEGEAKILAVFYIDAQMRVLAKDELMKRVVSDAENISPSEDPASVAIDSYDLDKNSVKLKVAYSGFAVLNPESGQLQKKYFFGKSKEEIRRYLLSLDHVDGVEVKFSPVWMLSAPSSEEKVTVVVKSVE